MRISASGLPSLFAFRSWLVRICLAVLTVLCASCASLPSFENLQRASYTGTKPRVEGKHGVLPPAQERAVLRKLENETDSELIERHLSFMSSLGNAPLITGNSVRLLIDGPATYAAMFAAIEAAQDHINLETYILDDDEVGQRFARKLVDMQSKGVQVNLFYDGVGAFTTSAGFFEEMKSKGVRICEFNPVNPLRGKLFSLNHRDHRKMLIVDGKVAFTGGINISRVYSSSIFGSSRKKKADVSSAWRDTHVEVRGPAVREFQQLFVDSWGRQKCALLEKADFFPPSKNAGNTVVQVLGSEAGAQVNLIYASLLSAIEHAERSIHITMAYFVPNAQLIEALKKAAHRGVDVRLVMPGFSDYWITFHAGRSHYAELLEGKVRIFERRDALLHAKTAVIDGVWSTVGSSNMDFRSFLHNDEVNAVILGADFAADMEAMFAADLQASVEITSEQWERRSSFKRFKERFARLWEYWL
jgi:cardiolipin synthase